MNKQIVAFKDYQNRIGNRMEMYKNVVEAFGISSILYPGSHIDIIPSLIVPKVIYVDSFKGTNQFFKAMDALKAYVTDNKSYQEEPLISFIYQDYQEPLEIEQVDLIISQFAGFVGQATKQYLKKDGILLCNDSHGDATLAYLDDDFEFIGVIGPNDQIVKHHLDQYFKFIRARAIDESKVKKTMKGPKYKVQAKSYLFRKVM